MTEYGIGIRNRYAMLDENADVDPDLLSKPANKENKVAAPTVTKGKPAASDRTSTAPPNKGQVASERGPPTGAKDSRGGLTRPPRTGAPRQERTGGPQGGKPEQWSSSGPRDNPRRERDGTFEDRRNQRNQERGPLTTSNFSAERSDVQGEGYRGGSRGGRPQG